MSDVDRLVSRLNKDVDCFKGGLTVAEIVGALELVKADIIQEARELPE